MRLSSFFPVTLCAHVHRQTGYSVSLASTGQTLAIGGAAANNYSGATWIFGNLNGSWLQIGNPLVGTTTGYNNNSQLQNDYRQGWSVSLSSNGSLLVVGGIGFINGTGAAWIFASNGSTWSQMGSALVGQGFGFTRKQYQGKLERSFLHMHSSFVSLITTFKLSIPVLQGWSVAMAGDGSTIAVGGIYTDVGVGATWLYKNNGMSWIQVCTYVLHDLRPISVARM